MREHKWVSLGLFVALLVIALVLFGVTKISGSSKVECKIIDLRGIYGVTEKTTQKQ